MRCKAKEVGCLVGPAGPLLGVWRRCSGSARLSGFCLDCEKQRGYKPLSKRDQTSLRRVLKTDCDLEVVFPGYAKRTLERISEGAAVNKLRRGFLRETMQEARCRAYGQEEGQWKPS